MQNNTEVKPDEFQVGDVVWCILQGKGKVTHIESSSQTTYPVEVCFENGESIRYTQDGQYSEEFNRTLFFSEPKVEASVTRPFVSTLVGKNVVVETIHRRQIAGHVFEETPTQIKLDGGYILLKDLCKSVYEVSSENILTK